MIRLVLDLDWYGRENKSSSLRYLGEYLYVLKVVKVGRG